MFGKKGSEFVIIFGILFFVLSANAADPRPDMHALAQEITAMQKFLLTEADFSDPKNEKSIKESLTVIDKHVQHLGEGTFAEDPALKVNLSLLQQHISDAKRSFDTGGKSFSRFMLQSSLQMCIACHTRGKTQDFALPESDLSKLKPEDKADFYFATRQFEKGRAEFENMILNFPKNEVGLFPLRKALISMAVYYSRVKSDPAAGAAFFEKAGNNTNLPSYLQRELKDWSKDFKKWAKEKNAKEPNSDSQLLQQAKDILKSDDLSLISDSGRSFHVRRLRASVLLHKILESSSGKSPAKGEAIFYLGQIYHRISSNLFFRFGELYLKTCISEYPKTSTARKCYEGLERALSEGYSGSGGTNIPDDESIELARLRRLAY